MEVRGPCLITFRNGQPCRIYEVGTTEMTPKGYSNTMYYFDNWDDAETYVRYLYQVAGVADNHRKLRSKKIAAWEKAEIRAFLATLDLSVLEDAIKDLHPLVERSFIPKR